MWLDAFTHHVPGRLVTLRLRHHPAYCRDPACGADLSAVRSTWPAKPPSGRCSRNGMSSVRFSTVENAHASHAELHFAKGPNAALNPLCMARNALKAYKAYSATIRPAGA